MEEDGCTCILSIADDAHGTQWLAKSIVLTIDMALTMDDGSELVRKGVDAADTHTMQTTRDLVCIFVKLTASVQYGHDDLQGRTMLLGMFINRDASTIIDNLDRIIWQNGDLNIITIASQGLVDTVIDNLADEMMQTLDAGIADVHGRTFAHCLKTLEDLNMTGIVVVLYLGHKVLRNSY